VSAGAPMDDAPAAPWLCSRRLRRISSGVIGAATHPPPRRNQSFKHFCVRPRCSKNNKSSRKHLKGSVRYVFLSVALRLDDKTSPTPFLYVPCKDVRPTPLQYCPPLLSPSVRQRRSGTEPRDRRPQRALLYRPSPPAATAATTTTTLARACSHLLPSYRLYSKATV
jgi:hypothetical protein